MRIRCFTKAYLPCCSIPTPVILLTTQRLTGFHSDRLLDGIPAGAVGLPGKDAVLPITDRSGVEYVGSFARALGTRRTCGTTYQKMCF